MAVSALHFLATSAVVADARSGIGPNDTHISARNKCLNFNLIDMLFLPTRVGLAIVPFPGVPTVIPPSMLKFGGGEKPVFCDRKLV